VGRSRPILFFFFPAEDGIRDRNVTGVQTCALPISMCSRQFFKILPTASALQFSSPVKTKSFTPPCKILILRSSAVIKNGASAFRSEERRVGKESRARWSRENEKKKED